MTCQPVLMFLALTNQFRLPRSAVRLAERAPGGHWKRNNNKEAQIASPEAHHEKPARPNRRAPESCTSWTRSPCKGTEACRPHGPSGVVGEASETDTK